MSKLVGLALVAAACALPRAGWSQPDPATLKTGLQFLPPEQYASLPTAEVPLTGILPKAVDLSAQFPDPGDQGAQGSCVAWAVGYALRSYQERREIAWDFSEDSRFSPAYIYNQTKLNDCAGGTFFALALNLLTSKGAASLKAFPYDEHDCSRQPTPAVQELARPFRTLGWRRVNTMDEAEVKGLLAAGDPVLIGMPVDEGFAGLKKDAIYTARSGKALGGHAMVVVGYDDDKGAFRIINSWGTKWASDGFGWISYTLFTDPVTRVVREGYVVLDAPTTPRPVPGESGLLAVSAPAEVQVEIVSTRYALHGSRSVTKSTANHHCAQNCEGEPTRTNYMLDLAAGAGRLLRNPRLTCKSGACPYSAPLFVRLEDDGRRAVASWDVWGHPSTWELSAEEYSLAPVSRLTARVVKDGNLEVPVREGASAPFIRMRDANGQPQSILAGQSADALGLAFLGRKEQAGGVVYTYAVK